jgi:histidinol-phosphatase
VSLDLEELGAFASELADAADRISMGRFGGPVPAFDKPDGTPVTAVDRAIESTIRGMIAQRCPDHAVMGEEHGGRLDAGKPTWVIDPIDATKNYMRGVPVFATLVALVIDARPVIGVASAPAMGERWAAASGHGATRNGEPIGVSAISTLDRSSVLYSDVERFRAWPRMWAEFERLHDEVWRARSYGDYYNHLLVAAGCAEVAFEREVAPWDVAALECVVTEAGGRTTDFHGNPPLTAMRAGGPNGVLSTNGLLHDEFLARLEPGLP